MRAVGVAHALILWISTFAGTTSIAYRRNVPTKLIQVLGRANRRCFLGGDATIVITVPKSETLAADHQWS